MRRRCGWRGLAVAALALLAAAGRIARADVILDDSVTNATPDQASVELSWCAVMPGCTAIWQPGSPAVVILNYAPVDLGGMGPPAPAGPSHDIDLSPPQPSPPASPDVDDYIHDLGSPP